MEKQKLTAKDKIKKIQKELNAQLRNYEDILGSINDVLHEDLKNPSQELNVKIRNVSTEITNFKKSIKKLDRAVFLLSENTIKPDIIIEEE